METSIISYKGFFLSKVHLYSLTIIMALHFLFSHLAFSDLLISTVTYDINLWMFPLQGVLKIKSHSTFKNILVNS